MPRLVNRPTVAALLVVAPALEVVEQVISPLSEGSTADDLAAITAHPTAFVVSVLIGIVATIVYVPALVGLAVDCLQASPAFARVGAAVAVISMMGFMGVRGIQAVELQAVSQGLATGDAAALIDGVTSNPIGLVVLVLFLGGTVVGMLSLGVACWRTGFPRPAVALLLLFPFVDLAVQGHVGTIVSHAVLLAGLGWIASALLRGVPATIEPLNDRTPPVAVR